MNLHALAEEVASHQRSGQEMEKLTVRYPELTVEDAYRIQALCVEQALARGDRLTGWKMGLTSKAKQVSVGVDEAIYGRLLASMEMEEPVLRLEGFIHPRVEPEIAFVMKRELGGKHVTARDVWLATECIVPAIEVIDSRYRNFSFTLVDVVADNASAAKFILGDQGFSPYVARWDEVGVAVFRNGEVMQCGAGAAVLGHPVRSVVQLARMLARAGASIEPGMVVLTGGITEAVHVYAGDEIEVRYDELGTLRLSVGAE
ncbi:MAG: fumarylacetoacetate hydrolase family protein [Alicyclobacillus macrosporangiidus]|uniref:2-keto-4-pentenoate hydratase n=1 Tax=Alicyclobacillus macrosporangiidus TaxID=392015 RepID=UPI0026F0E4F9|nr:fumarylacetoacetate hydrolase family protein [Alicyclobacillus macrosporangiidus]MCL6598152.1 fumarylacetoacetate hydrolase family protein [Alicyclobacillus macrosporangiidus]